MYTLIILVLLVAPRHVVFHPDRLTLRAFPRMAMSPANILFTAEIVEARDLDCPKFIWTYPDDTQSTDESDCDPNDHPDTVRDSKRLTLPEGEWTIVVEAVQGKKSRRAAITVYVH